MAQTNVNIRMDEKLKQEFDWLCTELGLNMTTAFNLFARTVVRQHKIPFEIALNYPGPNTEAPEAIEEVKLKAKEPSFGKPNTDVGRMVQNLSYGEIKKYRELKKWPGKLTVFSNPIIIEDFKVYSREALHER